MIQNRFDRKAANIGNIYSFSEKLKTNNKQRSIAVSELGFH